ncbi:hypothetical protein EJ02DRAFT_448683 [Clathrospora elynae]|uniref:EthD domain-containing protein n=1 Tax=Clathrospora elynae TaxID=706981 RepID=A0A6A5S786_9PLEO|nr:hypothetical protein EJ02DRAFT_448683 [Clathrospora elynae]
MADSAENDCIQNITLIRRKRSLTPAQFYAHWENVHQPIVLTRYPQMHLSGSMGPIAANASAPNALSKIKLSTTLIEFDGIAMFFVQSLKQFTGTFIDRYYIEVMEPDEGEYLGKVGVHSGVVASFQDKMLYMVHQGRSTGTVEDSLRERRA